MGSVRREEAHRRLVRGLPGYPVGMVLLARLAVDQSEQGKGRGALLLGEALRKAVAAGEAAPARLGRRHRRVGLLVLPTSRVRPPPDHPLRLYRRMSDIRASLQG